jgi:predicted house-cleaning noncanonical NTP pyrophosphatase (MazG superfamily)
MDPLFLNIEDIIGISIERLLINITARGNKYYIYNMIPEEARQMIKNKELEVLPFVETITTLAQLYGNARYELLGFRFENGPEDYAKHRIIEPYSLPLTVGAYAGAVSGIVGGEAAVSYKKVTPDEYIYTAQRTQYPAILKEKLRMPEYEHKDGDIELERCATCGCPREVASYEWNVQEGKIINRRTGRRMVLLGPAQLDHLFDALEAELGEAIPQTVIEAQRRFVRTGFFSIDIMEGEEGLRTQLALRGLGNLKELKISSKKASLRVDNACMHLILTGLVQGNFELAFDVDSNLAWEFTREGDLSLEVVPK